MVRAAERSSKTSDFSSRTQRAAGHSDIVAVLGSEILSGKREPGSRLPSEDEMFETFGVSRVVLREVSRTLAAKGMVSSKTRVGTVVLDGSHWNWLDADVLAWQVKLGLNKSFLAHITEVRLAVEPTAAALAARNRTGRDLANLRAAVKRMREAEGNHHEFSEADLNFHVAISVASKNPLFRSFTGVIDVALSSFLSLTAVGAITDEKDHTRSTARHAQIVDAIEARNEAAAIKAMIHVIEAGRRHASRPGSGI